MDDEARGVAGNEVRTLESRIRGIEWERAWEQEDGLSAFTRTPQFEQPMNERIEEHMKSNKVQYKITKFRDQGFKAFRDQAKIIYPDVKFATICPEEEEPCFVEDGVQPGAQGEKEAVQSAED
ncbi:hypothetical protein U1Q18_007867 [Sarracenia purpurea var. burkii]